jgi:hypothetical protein
VSKFGDTTYRQRLCRKLPKADSADRQNRVDMGQSNLESWVRNWQAGRGAYATEPGT